MTHINLDEIIRDISNELTLRQRNEKILSKLYQLKKDLEGSERTDSIKDKLEKVNILISKLENI